MNYWKQTARAIGAGLVMGVALLALFGVLTVLGAMS